MDLTISVTNTNRRDYLRECLQSLVADTSGIDAEIIVVDNASTDGSAEMVAEEFPGVQVLRNEVKRGYATNHNRIFSIAQGKYILVHTEDVYVLSGALPTLVAFLDAHPRAGIVGPQVRRAPYLRERTGAAYLKYPTPGNLLRQNITAYLGLRKLFPGARWVQKQDIGAKDFTHSYQVAHVDGCCFLLRREALKDVRGFDETFPYYYGETDLCYRLRQAGWEIWFEPRAVVAHYGTLPYVWSKQRSLLMLQSIAHFNEKHFGIWAARGVYAV
ncbi:MAG TPA: glycosyltransferase family 2 protein, partial [Desulfobacterales bacterium]|nr:glycosyltransferase family 2 protein [Desulfobacterales bacterium]